MAKAVLVMDMPESCDKCPLFFGFYADMTCRANGYGIDYPYPDKDRQDWCPLKPIPEKVTKSIHDSDETWFWNQGWNHCIDKILGEGESD